MTDNFAFELSSVEASVVGQALGVDVQRFPLRFRNTTTDPVRLIKLATLVTGELVKRRLVIGNDLHPRVREAFEILGRQRVSVAMSGIDGLGADIAVLALTDGAQAVGITQHGKSDDLGFALFADDDFVDRLAGVLPPMPAASGAPATVRQTVTEYRSALAARRAEEREHDEEETDAFGNLEVVGAVRPARQRRNARNTNESDEDRLRRVLAGERLGGGHIIITGAGNGSGKRPAPRTLSWLDTGDGRYLVHTTEDGNETTAHYSPASGRDVARAIRDRVSDVY